MSPYAASDRERWVAEDPQLKRGDRDDFARDRGRLIHSASLRRLSAKTQVLSPGSDDFVRNRLTHSLEVAQIGREFGAALGCNADVVDSAALAHDLGHPPFGHNGERALNSVAADIGGFEGNAQTLRILTRLEAKRTHPDGRSAGLNLTRASLDASTKYPWPRGGSGSATAKFGVYDDDLDVYAWLRGGRPDGQRCLEADVMDWSDDVAYSVHDVEDAIASRRLDPRTLFAGDESAAVLAVARGVYAPHLSGDDIAAALARLLAANVVPAAYGGTRSDLAALKDMTSRLIGWFVQSVEVATRAVYGTGDLGRYAARLVIPDEVLADVAVLKAVAAHFVMNVDERLALLAAQREIVTGLAAAYSRDPGLLDFDLRADYDAADDDGAALRVIVDQVASLTDTRALELAKSWDLIP